ncbi:hypothetical protein FQA39_LY10151 [Lamprigera yunnana]|nr:hypothetical protein FQA39_LY10151 [Lamprigera yunnana]
MKKKKQKKRKKNKRKEDEEEEAKEEEAEEEEKKKKKKKKKKKTLRLRNIHKIQELTKFSDNFGRHCVLRLATVKRSDILHILAATTKTVNMTLGLKQIAVQI